MRGWNRRSVNVPMPEPDPDKPPFLPLLGYVVGFMALLGVLARYFW